MSSILVPSSLLQQTITVHPWLGDGAEGPSFGDPVELRARVVGRRRVVRSAGGNDRTSTQTATVRPGPHVPPTESRVDFDGDTYEVAEVIPLTGLRGPAGFDLVLV